jgi:mono/diheme cytochrome c family protein
MLSAGSEPGRVVLEGTTHAHVVLRSKGALARISLSSHEVERETAVCKLPRGISYDAQHEVVWVACADGELVSLAAETHAELTRSFVAHDLRDVVVTPSGKRFVSRYRSAELLHVGADGKVEGSAEPNVSWAFNGLGETVTKSPALAWRTALGPNGKVVMLHQQAQNEPVTVEPGGYGGGCGGAITQAGITEFDGQGAPELTGTVEASLAVDVAVAPGGKSFALALPGNYLLGRSTLQVVSKSAIESASESSESAEASDAPRAGTRRESENDGDRPSVGCGRAPFPGGSIGEAQITALAYDAKGLLYALSREPAQLDVYELSDKFPFPLLVQTVRLDERSVRDTGHELFHADVGGGLACASCHGEALDDGHVWTFEGFGPRRTQNMRGGISHTLPLHWEGDMQTFQHLVDEVMTGRMSGFKVEPKYADALSTWIDQQPELTIDARDAAARERGRALFRSKEVACATCHSGEMLTNNETVSVGTGGKFQVPSLLGLGLRAPYMHDGCAKTLTQRFEKKCGGGDKHGKTSQLSKAQIADLVAYLESL